MIKDATHSALLTITHLPGRGRKTEFVAFNAYGKERYRRTGSVANHAACVCQKHGIPVSFHQIGLTKPKLSVTHETRRI